VENLPMGEVSKILRSLDGHRVGYWCEGCDELHVIRFVNGLHTWDGNIVRPTFSPSVFYEQKGADGREHVCHTFIRDGLVQFLDECTHHLAGLTLPLPDLPEYLLDGAEAKSLRGKSAP
jgi:hypothetical protein